jgi:hypothetical protein
MRPSRWLVAALLVGMEFRMAVQAPVAGMRIWVHDYICTVVRFVHVMYCSTLLGNDHCQVKLEMQTAYCSAVLCGL